MPSSILSVVITGDATKAKRALEDTEAALGKTETRADRFNNTMKRAAVPAAALTAGVIALGKSSFESASALEQSTGAIESVFGAHAAGMQATARQAAQSVGLAQSQYQDLATVLGSQLKNMGISTDELAGQTDNLIGLGADLSATFGGSTADAVSALSSLMRGERDPIERYGVSIKAADVEAKKAAMGLSGLTGEADNAATTQATLALLMEQTAGAQGAFAREAETAAGQQARATASWENAKATLGQSLLPAVTAASAALATLATWVGENSAVIVPIIAVIGALAAGVLAYNAVVAATPAFTAAATAAQWLWNAAMSANPLGLIVLGIAAVIAVIVILIRHWDTVKEVAGNVFSAIADGARAAGAVFSGFIDRIGDAIQRFFGWLSGIPGRIANAFSAAVPGWVSTIGGWIGFQVPGTAGMVNLTPPTSPLEAAIITRTPSPTRTASSSPLPAGDYYHIEIHDAYDPIAVGDRLADILNERGRRNGTLTLGGRLL